jgi:inosose dehydratase
VLERAAAGNWDYFEAVRQGVFCELGKGCVDFPAVAIWLRRREYSGYVTVEQDVLPGMGTPKESAQRNRDYLLSIAL